MQRRRPPPWTARPSRCRPTHTAVPSGWDSSRCPNHPRRRADAFIRVSLTETAKMACKAPPCTTAGVLPAVQLLADWRLEEMEQWVLVSHQKEGDSEALEQYRKQVQTFEFREMQC